PGLHSLTRALREVLRWPTFFARMWMLCLTSAAALFAVYVVQSPLSRLASSLARQSPKWWPLYTVIAAFGYWASSRGSRTFRLRSREIESGATALRLAVGALFLLGLYPLAFGLRGRFADERWPLLFAAALMCLLFNYLRGIVEPYSATA